jgi:LysM repeat protein
MRKHIRTYAQHLKVRNWYERLTRGRPRLRGVLSMIAVFLIVASTFLVANTTSASYTNVLANGSFEQGFTSQPGCGMVGAGWWCFTNGGAANYGFYDDQWDPVVADGEHSQLIEVNTKGIMSGDADRYAGIYQTVRVVDWAEYTLNLRGMIRTTNLTGDPWRYRVQVGWTAGYQASWGTVTNWTDVGWDTYYERTSPGSLQSFSTRLKAEDDYITIYIRVWKKWGVPEEEIDINLDAIALTGPAPYGHYEPPVHDKPHYKHDDPSSKHDYPPKPKHDYPSKPAPSGACTGQELVYNGGFEYGFNAVAVGHVGKSWGYFTNGGAANYGFYDEQWPPVVAEGTHGQLIEINSKGIYPSDPDRYAGIYQRIGWLEVGHTYELTIRGLLRGAGNEDDPYRFEAQWGYNVGYDTDWSHVSNWQGMDLGKIYPRTEPGSLAVYTVRFTAPANEIVLFIRGWKKWGISEVEMDFNLDAISLRSCTAYPVIEYYPVIDKYPVIDPYPVADSCSYTVQAGDTLSWIAEQYGVSLRALKHANGIDNPNLIYVGQVLTMPDCWVEEPYEPPVVEPCPAACSGAHHKPPRHHPEPWTEPDHEAAYTHVVQPGETFSYLCELYGTDPYTLAEINGITNWDLIYVGQVLTIP